MPPDQEQGSSHAFPSHLLGNAAKLHGKTLRDNRQVPRGWKVMVTSAHHLEEVLSSCPKAPAWVLPFIPLSVITLHPLASNVWNSAAAAGMGGGKASFPLLWGYSCERQVPGLADLLVPHKWRKHFGKELEFQQAAWVHAPGSRRKESHLVLTSSAARETWLFL